MLATLYCHGLPNLVTVQWFSEGVPQFERCTLMSLWHIKWLTRLDNPRVPTLKRRRAMDPWGLTGQLV